MGATLGILLAQRGRRVIVLERQAQPYPLPRAVHLDGEAARILQGCGIGPDLGVITEPAEVYEWRTADGRVLLRFGRIGRDESGWPQSLMFHQPDLEGLLGQRSRSLPALQVRRGAEVTALQPDDEGVTIIATADDRPMAVRADLVVGCDGADSVVRRLIDVPMSDLGASHEWLIADCRLREPRTFDPVNVQVCDPARPTTAVSAGPGRRRWEFMRLPGESAEDLATDAAVWRLLAPWDVTPTNAHLERRTLYTFRARLADRWRSGRVLLAGDAAHQMPPFAGQGLCSGLRDAANLAWKLDLVLGDRASASLLDSYVEERRDNVRDVIDFSEQLGNVICMTDPDAAEARDRAMIDARVPGELTPVPALPRLPDTGLCLTGSEGAGELLVQGRVTDGVGGVGRFDDLIGVGWRLLVVPEVFVDPSLATWFASIGGRVLRIGRGGDLGDPDGTYSTWLAEHGVVGVLQRPDFHIVGSAVDAVGVEELLRYVRSYLDAPGPKAPGTA